MASFTAKQNSVQLPSNQAGHALLGLNRSLKALPKQGRGPDKKHNHKVPFFKVGNDLRQFECGRPYYTTEEKCGTLSLDIISIFEERDRT